jgi:hypothetical protein
VTYVSWCFAIWLFDAYRDSKLLETDEGTANLWRSTLGVVEWDSHGQATDSHTGDLAVRKSSQQAFDDWRGDEPSMHVQIDHRG